MKTNGTYHWKYVRQIFRNDEQCHGGRATGRIALHNTPFLLQVELQVIIKNTSYNIRINNINDQF